MSLLAPRAGAPQVTPARPCTHTLLSTAGVWETGKDGLGKALPSGPHPGMILFVFTQQQRNLSLHTETEVGAHLVLALETPR